MGRVAWLLTVNPAFWRVISKLAETNIFSNMKKIFYEMWGGASEGERGLHVINKEPFPLFNEDINRISSGLDK